MKPTVVAVLALLVGCGPGRSAQAGNGSGSTAAPATAPVSSATPPAPPSAPVAAKFVTGPAFPPRPKGAPTGREFLDKTASLPRLSHTGPSREASILHEIENGNVPDYDRTFVDVTLDWQGHHAVVHVTPDYLAIGSNDDNVRMPMGAPTAQAIADKLDCVLPTKKLVDAIWKEAVVKLAPHPLPPTAAMITNAWFRKHADAVDAQLVGKPRGVLTAGHKKDVILDNLITLHPGHVIIYGWHQLNGKPIQGRQWIHEATYADYSHGIRLVSRHMELDGKTVDILSVLKDANLAPILSDEGPIVGARY